VQLLHMIVLGTLTHSPEYIQVGSTAFFSSPMTETQCTLDVY